MLMCRPHWYAVPLPLRQAVLRHYRPGQEVTKDPSIAWVHASIAAIRSVAKR